MRGRVSTDDLIIFPRNRSELPAVSERLSRDFWEPGLHRTSRSSPRSRG